MSSAIDGGVASTHLTLQVDELKTSLSRLRESDEGPKVWRWAVDGVIVAASGEDADDDSVCFEASAVLAHRLLTGTCSELVEMARGQLIGTGATSEVLRALRALPLVGAAYCEQLGISDFEIRPINVMRALRPHPGSAEHGFPERLDGGPADQAYLLALVLAGLPPACRVTQAAEVAQVFAHDRGLAQSKLVLVLSELADLVAGACNRNATPCSIPE